MLALTVWALAHLGVGNPDAELMRIVRLTAVFAGVAALLTAGGIGRLAAQVFVDGVPAGGEPVAEHGRRRRRAILRAAGAHAVASAGLVIIAAIPHGRLPATSAGWLAFPAAGLVCGAIAGAIVGYVCSSQSVVQLVDVWSLTRKPRVALRTILDPEDLARLGSALRTRTTNLFDGIFEPGEPPPRTPAGAASEARAPGRDGRSASRAPAAPEAAPAAPEAAPASPEAAPASPEAAPASPRIDA